jgi:Methyltransferase domain
VAGFANRFLDSFGQLSDWTAALVWFFRDKLALPVKTSGIVVDVGSGHSPHFRAHVLVEKYMTDKTGHRIGKFARRHASQIVCIADAERLPFCDRAIDFVIASHLFEHLSEPEMIAAEFSRAARGGYVECPSEWIERMFPFPSHLWYVSSLPDGSLRFVPKQRDRDRYLERVLLANLGSERHLRGLFHDRTAWTERLVWRDVLRCQVEGPPDEPDPDGSTPHHPNPPLIDVLRQILARGLSPLFRPAPLAEETILGAMCCPDCRDRLSAGADGLTCRRCNKHYPRSGFTIDFLHPTPGANLLPIVPASVD